MEINLIDNFAVIKDKVNNGCGDRVVISSRKKSGSIVYFVVDTFCDVDMWKGVVVVRCVLEKSGVTGIKYVYTFLIYSWCLGVKNKV